MTRNRSCVGLGTAALLLVIVGACSTSDPAPSGPGGAVQTFYDHLNAGRLAEAKALYTAEALATVDDTSTAEDLFGTWARHETRDGTVEAVEIVESVEIDDQATVRFVVVFEGGERVEHEVRLVREGESWLLGLIL